MVKSVYVNANSKKHLNRLIENSFTSLIAFEYTIEGKKEHLLYHLEMGTIVRIYAKMNGINPVPKCYGILARRKDGSVYVR